MLWERGHAWRYRRADFSWHSLYSSSRRLLIVIASSVVIGLSRCWR